MFSTFFKLPERSVLHAPALCAFLMLTLLSQAARAEISPLEGKWDITIEMDGKKLPSWLEVRHSGYKTLVGQFVGTSGSARPVSVIHVKGDQFSFAIPPQWESGTADIRVNGVLRGDKISGTLISSEGATYPWTGERAPSLRRSAPVTWGTPVRLIRGNTLQGWKALGAKNEWTVKNGVLTNPKSGANLVTEATFDDFKLQLEFRVPKGSNSGVYLRGRYEVQITDSKGKAPAFDQLGAIYGFITPVDMPAKDAGEWQSLEVTLTGRLVTVSLNGKIIIHPQEIPGITGGALDSREGAPGPLMIQGDHGPIEYRNIVITPAR